MVTVTTHYTTERTYGDKEAKSQGARWLASQGMYKLAQKLYCTKFLIIVGRCTAELHNGWD